MPYSAKNIVTIAQEIGYHLEEETLFDLIEETTDCTDSTNERESTETVIDPHHYYFMKKAGSASIHQKEEVRLSAGSGNPSAVASLSEYISNTFTSEFENSINPSSYNSFDETTSKHYTGNSITIDSGTANQIGDSSLLSSPFPLYPAQFNYDPSGLTPTTPNFRNIPDYDEISSTSSVSTEPYLSPTPMSSKRSAYSRDNHDFSAKDIAGDTIMFSKYPIFNINVPQGQVRLFDSVTLDDLPVLLSQNIDSIRTRSGGYFAEDFNISCTSNDLNPGNTLNYELPGSPVTSTLPALSHNSQSNSITGDVALSTGILQRVFSPSTPYSLPLFEHQSPLNFSITYPEVGMETKESIDDYNYDDVYRPFASGLVERQENVCEISDDTTSPTKETKPEKTYPITLRIRKPDGISNLGFIQKSLFGTRRKSLTVTPPMSQPLALKSPSGVETKRRHSFNGRRRSSLGSVDLAEINRAISDIPKHSTERNKLAGTNSKHTQAKRKSGPLPASKTRTTIFKSSLPGGFPYFNTEYTIDGKLMIFSLRCDIINADFTRLTPFTIEQWSIYPSAVSLVGNAHGGRRKYEHQVNVIGLALLLLNPSIQKITLKRANQFATGLLQRCVDSFRNSDDNLMSRRTKKVVAYQHIEETKIVSKSKKERRKNLESGERSDFDHPSFEIASLSSNSQGADNKDDYALYSSDSPGSISSIDLNCSENSARDFTVLFKYNDKSHNEQGGGDRSLDSEDDVDNEVDSEDEDNNVFLVREIIPANRLPSAFTQLSMLVSRYQPLLEVLSERQPKRHPRNKPST